MIIVALKKAGALRNGWERGKGSIFHAVEMKEGVFADDKPALCGARPAIMWTGDGDDTVTCPKCLKRIGFDDAVVMLEESELQ